MVDKKTLYPDWPHCESCLFFEDWIDGSHRCGASLPSRMAPFRTNRACSMFVEATTLQTLVECLKSSRGA